MQIIENFIENDFADWIETEMIKGNFYWHYYDEIAQYSDNTEFEDKRIVNPNGFIHVMYNAGQGPTSPYFNSMAAPILKKAEKTFGFEVDKIIRVRTRMTVPIPGYKKECFSPPHVDMRDLKQPYKTLVYYVNNSDGDFILFKDKFDPKTETDIKNKNFTEETRVSPRKNRAVSFDGHIYHAGNVPIDNKYRIIINFDFIVK